MQQTAQQNEPSGQAAEHPPVTNVPAPPDCDLIEHESLVEEVSIDGMCGVY
jgi:mycofactocin precursor